MFGSIYNLQLSVQGASQLIRTRNLLKGFGEASYSAFDNATRALNKFDKSTGRVINRLSSMAVGGGIAYGALNMLNYSLLQSNSLIKTNTILLEELTGNKTAVRGYMTMIQDLSASYGQDMNELMASAKGMMQVMNQAGKTVPADLERIMKLIMTLNLLDTENRGLSYVAFSVREMFQGLGRADFRSLKSRLEINFGRAMEDSIVKAIRSGNVTQAVTMIEEAFASVGVKSDKIMGRILEEGTMQNINRLSTYISRFFQILGEDSFNAMARPLNKLNEFIGKYFSVISEYNSEGEVIGMRNSAGLDYMLSVSKKLKERYIDPMIDSFYRMGEVVYRMRGSLGRGFLSSVEGIFKVVQSTTGVFVAFAKGLFGVSHEFTNYETTVGGLVSFLEVFGKYSNIAGTYIAKMIPYVNELARSINMLAVSFTKLFAPNALGGELGAIGTLLAGGAKLASGALAGTANVIGGVSQIPFAGELATMALGGFLGGKLFGRMFGGKVAGGTAGTVMRRGRAGKGTSGNVSRGRLPESDIAIINEMRRTGYKSSGSTSLGALHQQLNLKTDYNRRISAINSEINSLRTEFKIKPTKQMLKDKAIKDKQILALEEKKKGLLETSNKIQSKINDLSLKNEKEKYEQLKRNNALQKIADKASTKKAEQPTFQDGFKAFLASPLGRIGSEGGIMAGQVGFQVMLQSAGTALATRATAVGGYLTLFKNALLGVSPVTWGIVTAGTAVGAVLLQMTKQAEDLIAMNQKRIDQDKAEMVARAELQIFGGAKNQNAIAKFKELSMQYGAEKTLKAIQQVVLSGKGQGWVGFLELLTKKKDPSGKVKDYNAISEFLRLGGTETRLMELLGGTSKELGKTQDTRDVLEVHVRGDFPFKEQLQRDIDESVRRHYKAMQGKENSKKPTQTDEVSERMGYLGKTGDGL